MHVCGLHVWHACMGMHAWHACAACMRGMYMCLRVVVGSLRVEDEELLC